MIIMMIINTFDKDENVLDVFISVVGVVSGKNEFHFLFLFMLCQINIMSYRCIIIFFFFSFFVAFFSLIYLILFNFYIHIYKPYNV